MKYFVAFAIVLFVSNIVSGQNVSTTSVAALNSTLDGGLDALVGNETKAATTEIVPSPSKQQQQDVNVSTEPLVPVKSSSQPPPPPPPPQAATTPIPKPAVPAPKVISYSLNSTTAADKYCILISSAVQFHVLYPAENNTVAETTFNAGDNFTVMGGISSCGNKSTAAKLSIDYYAFQVHYTFDTEADSKYSLAHLSLSFRYGDSDLFPGSDVKDPKFHGVSAMINGTSYAVPNDHSYRCDVEKTLALIGDEEKLNGTASISSFKFAAFGQFVQDNYGEAEECSDDFTTSDIVPIAVGCALAALVVIVLIAYLVGRRRSRQKGYQSV